MWIIEDVTAVRKSAEVLMSLAERDALTGLFNRRRFDEDLDRTLGEAVARAPVRSSGAGSGRLQTYQ